MASLSHPSFPASTSALKTPPDSGDVRAGAGSVPKGTTELPWTLGPFLNLLFSSPHSRAQVTLWTILRLDLLQSHSVCTSLSAPAGTGRQLRQSIVSAALASSAPQLRHQQQLGTGALDHCRGTRGSQAGVLSLTPPGMCRENKAVVMGEIP